jgi:hypothetical protein
MPKEKNYNPVQAAKKAEKARTLKKHKAQLQAQRNERLAHRNPARLQRDIDELKELEQLGQIRPHDRQRLAQLEKDVAAIRKAREALGDKAPKFREYKSHDRGRGGGVLGKRRRDGTSVDADQSSDTDDDVRDIPMPRDTPPPIPRKPQPRRASGAENPTDPNAAPPEAKKPVLVLEAEPVHRDFMKEATRFVPRVVQMKKKLAAAEGVLPDPEELDKLEKAGYLKAKSEERGEDKKGGSNGADVNDPELEEAEKELLKEIGIGGGTGDPAEEAVEAATREAQHRMMEKEAEGEVMDAKGVERQLRHVEIEEVEDEDL